MGFLWLPHMHWTTLVTNRDAGGGGLGTPPLGYVRQCHHTFKFWSGGLGEGEEWTGKACGVGFHQGQPTT